MREEVSGLVRKAERALQAAAALEDAGFPSDAASKAYYAMFYAAQAILKSLSIEVVKHSAVEAAFGLHLAKAGKIDVKYHRMLIDARRVREIADYGIEEEIVEPAASVKLDAANAFVAEAKRFLGMSFTQ